MRTLQDNMKSHSTLPMGFAVIPILRERKASDPRDLCYGLYGVLEVEGLTHLTLPDYRKDRRAVFREFLLDLLQWENAALVLLLDCCGFEEPSWSPDWRVATRQSWLDERYFYGISPVSATPRSLPYFESTDDRRSLFVYGIEANHAEVLWTSDLAAELDWGEECLNILLDWIRIGLGPIDTVYTREQVHIFEALEASLFTDGNFFTSPAEYNAQKTQAHLSSGFKTWFTLVEPYVTSGAATDGRPASRDSGTSGEQEPTTCYEKIMASDRAREYHVKICKQISGKRRLFLFSSSSSKGIEFGTGSQAVEVGDIIYLISGLPVPMVLRSSGISIEYSRNGKTGAAEGLTVVGPAFVPGLMKGEGWPKPDWLKGEWKQPLARERLKEICLI
jgi:hypothetical protein